MRTESEFRLGRYWLDRVPGSDRWYRFWYDPGSGEVRRRSLKTAAFEEAKIALAAVVLKEGSGKAADPTNVMLVTVFSRYWEQHSDHTRSRSTARLGLGKLLDFLGETAKVSVCTRSRQRAFFKAMRVDGYAIATIATWMVRANAAFNRALATDDEDVDALLTRAPKLIYSARAIATVLNEPEPEPRNWHPDLEMIAAFLDGLNLPEEEAVRRFTILLLGLCCRPEAALDAGPFSLDRRYRLIRLNPPGRRQTKKHRPTVPLADSIWSLLEGWTDGVTFIHVKGKRPAHLTKQWNQARDRVGLPKMFVPYSLRHFMATALRHAHLRYGVPRVPRDECEMMMGHRRASTNELYGVFEPDYLSAAKGAVDATLMALNAACNRPFLRQVSAKSIELMQPENHIKILK